MTGYGGPGYDLPRRRQGSQGSFEDSGSWGGFFHPDKAPVTEQIPRVREPAPREREVPPPPDDWQPEIRRSGAWRPDPPVREDLMAPPRPPGPPPAPVQPPPAPPAPPKRGVNRLVVAAAVLGVLVLVLAGAATFILVKG